MMPALGNFPEVPLRHHNLHLLRGLECLKPRIQFWIRPKTTDVVNLVYSKEPQAQSSSEKMPETEASVTTQGLSFTLPQRKGRGEERQYSGTMVNFAK